jgi:hypothetical protein
VVYTPARRGTASAPLTNYLSMAIPVTLIREKFLALKPVMDERLTRLWAGAEAEAIGAGGIALVAAATGMSRTTIRAGRDELRKGVAACDVVKIRRAGAGRPPIEKRTPEIIDALELLLDPAAHGDREAPLRWTAKSTRKLSAELDRQGFSISPQKVAQLLHAGGYRLQGVDRPLEGAPHAVRGQQLELIHDRVKAFIARGAPVIAVEIRKQQLAPEIDPTAGSAPRPAGRAGRVPTSHLASLDPTPGAAPRLTGRAGSLPTPHLTSLDPTVGFAPRPAGRAGSVPTPHLASLDLPAGFAPRPAGRAGRVPTSRLGSLDDHGPALRRESPPVAAHDARDRAPHELGAPGGSEVARGAGWVNAEADHETPAFAARTISHWWEHMARHACAGATELLVIADVSGNGAHTRRWRAELQLFADRVGLTIGVSHFPPATSKWTRIEHRLICQVTERWRGRPVIHRESVVQLIGGARPAVGSGTVPPLDARGTPAEWNYTLYPRRDRW